jgi:hypothetical protein
MAKNKRLAIAVASCMLVLIGLALLALALRETVSRYAASYMPGQAGMPGPPFGQQPQFGQSPLDPVATFIMSLVPTPGPPPPPTPVPPPTPPAPTPYPPVPKSTPNIAWGAQTADALTIWVGSYSDKPSPRISDAHPVVSWGIPQVFPIRLFDMAVSPDQRSIAVLGAKPWARSDGSSTAGWLSVVSLDTNGVQTIPAYSNYQLYQEYGYAPPLHILGWLDNDRLAVESTSSIRIASKDGASSTTLWDSGAWVNSALSPDRMSVFSYLGGDNYTFVLHSTDGASQRSLTNVAGAYPLDYPAWSPDGKRIAYLAFGDTSASPTSLYMGLRLLDIGNSTQVQISSPYVWDAGAVWSDDGTQIAFLRADEPVTDYVTYSAPDNVNTNIYTVHLDDLAPKPLTGFTGVKNSGLQWTPGGNLILSSTSGSADGMPRLVAVSPQDGTSTSVLTSSTGISLTHPILFK